MTDSPQQRVLNALSLEKHLTARQLARLLYPQEFTQETSNPAYQRVMKNLQKLRRDGLLKSKSYGLGREMLWSLTGKKIVRDLGLVPPKSEVHSFLYEHEKDLGDVFVSLALTGTLYAWQGEGDQKIGLRYDRLFQVDDRTFYVERERGTQGRDKLITKLGRYNAYYRKTRESFCVLILGDETELYTSIFGELRLSSHYLVALYSDFIKDPLNTRIASRFGLQTLFQTQGNSVE